MAPAAGERLRLSVVARVEPGGGATAGGGNPAGAAGGATAGGGNPAGAAGGAAEISLSAEGADGKALAAQQAAVTGAGWRRYDIELPLPPAARRVTVALRASGAATAWFDDVRLEAASAAGTAAGPATPGMTGAPKAPGAVGAARTLLADSFESAPVGETAAGWTVPMSSRKVGWSVEAVAGPSAYAGARSVRIARRPGLDLPDPGRPLIAPLGTGLAALVPLALYADAAGTLPHPPGGPDGPDVSGAPVPAQAPAAASAPGAATPEAVKPSTNDRTAHLAAVILLSAALERFYPQFEDIAAGWPAVRDRALRDAAEDRSPRAFLDTLRRLVAGLADGHAEVIDMSDDADFRLPLFWQWLDGQLVVTWADPAAETGLAPGDAVLTIDGRSAGAALAALLPLAPGATAGFREAWALEQLAAGAERHVHELVVDHGGRRRTVRLPCTANRFGPHRFIEARHQKVEEIQPRVFYLDLARIDDDDFNAVLPRLEQARAIVFDMRGYPEKVLPDLFLGHLIDHPLRLSDAVIVRNRPLPPGTRAASRPDVLDVVSWQIEPVAPRLSAKVAFLTDARAVSRAEDELSFVHDTKLAPIVGSPTAGTRGEVNEMDLPTETGVFWTGTLALQADGTPYHGQGIPLTLPVRPTRAGLAAGRDEQLDAAVGLLLGGR